MGDFRPLYTEIMNWNGKGAAHRRTLYDVIIQPWLEAHPEHIDWVKAFAARNGSPIPEASPDDLWDLYSLSRVNDIMIASLQEGEKLDWFKWHENLHVSADEYLAFADTMGCSIAEANGFTPFLHEIVEVLPAADADAPIEVVGEFWPAVMLGPMLFSRAGVMVSGGANHITKEIAERSKLYWTWARRNRPVSDLSHGWGSNSQWRTDFRRDYLIDNAVHYNAHNPPRPPWTADPDPLTPSDRKEILLNRGFIKSRTPDDDLWPYQETAILPLGVDVRFRPPVLP